MRFLKAPVVYVLPCQAPELRPGWLQDRMHLDCVFSILGDDCCLMMEEMMGEDSPTKRLVDEWTRDDATGGYNLTRQNVEFSEFMRGEGYSIVPIKAEHQLVSPAMALITLKVSSPCRK